VVTPVPREGSWRISKEGEGLTFDEVEEFGGTRENCDVSLGLQGGLQRGSYEVAGGGIDAKEPSRREFRTMDN